MTTQKDKNYQRCTRCVMDTTDAGIQFDENGVCDFCHNYDEKISALNIRNEETKAELLRIADTIRKKGKNKKYDCIIGFSGGVDSSYVAYIAKEIMHLRPLLYCVDTGWNFEPTMNNMRGIAKKLDLDLVTEVVDWNEMADLQLAYLKSQVIDQDTPQDHAIFAGLYNYAMKHGLKYVLSGANLVTEWIVPGGGWDGGNDIVLLKDIHKKFGKVPLRTFPLCGMFKYKLYYQYVRGMKRIAPLNYLPFNEKEVKNFLASTLDWKGYENKHYENLFTRWYEGYYLLRKYNYDKRITYFSNLILAGQMTREEALEKLAQPPYEDGESDTKEIAARLGITYEEMEAILEQENKSKADYRNSTNKIVFAKKIAVLLGIEKRFPQRSK